jgi:hypothetical protein
MDQEGIRLFEKLEDLIERRFSEVKDAQADVARRVGNLEVLGAAQGEQLKYHIRRTDLADERAEIYRKEAAERAAAIEDIVAANKKELDDALKPLLVNEAAKSKIGGWVYGVGGFVFAAISAAAAWLALK